MHTCEIYSIKKSKKDFDALSRDYDRVTAALAEHGVDVHFRFDIGDDPRRLCAAVTTSVAAGGIDLYLFANALNTSDSSSFRRLFYELIAALEAELPSDEAHAGMTPKLRVFSLGDLGSGYKGYCFRYGDKAFVAVPYASLAGEDSAALLCRAVVRASEVLTAHREDYPDGVAYAAGVRNAPRKKESFLRSFIPHRGDSRSRIIRKVIVLIALVAFVGALGYVVNFFVVAPMQNDSITAEIQNIAYRTDLTDETTPEGEKLARLDWAALKKINKEIVGWVRMDGTPIDYPILFHKGDDRDYQYYLDHTYKNEYSDYGSIFIDYRSAQGMKSKNLILHGHNMINGSMFHELVNYTGGDSFTPKLDYYKKHPVINVNSPEGDAKWKVISVFKTSTFYDHGMFFNYMQGEFNSDAEFMNFVYNVRIRSLFNTPVTVNEDDQIVTLSTCSYEFTGFRTVLVARKVRPGEDESVDVRLAKINENPLYPDVYYSAYGGTRPDPMTFKQAYAQGLISWYDGKGNLKGSEVLTGTVAENPTQVPTAEPSTAPPATAAPVYYKVTYRNIDRSEFAVYQVKKGDPVPVPSATPTYEDRNYTYEFIEWDRSIEGVNFSALNSSIVIYPKYNPIPKVTAAPTQPPTRPPTQPPTDPPTVSPTEPPAAPSTEQPTQPPTEP